MTDTLLTRAPRATLLAALLLLGSSGCGGVFSSAETLTVFLLPESGDAEHPEPRTVLSFRFPSERDCPSLPEGLRATQNGVPMEVLERGYWRQGGPILDSSGCVRPRLNVEPPPPSEALTTFVLDDGGAELVAEFRDLGTPVTGRLLEPADAVLRPGQRAVVEFAPASAVLTTPFVQVQSINGRDLWHARVALQQEGAPHTFSFVVPEGASVGQARIELRGGSQAGVARCTAGACLAEKNIHFDIPITLAPREG
jgi:hypothetical protein